MTMLSRVADRLYWMARYLERAENTARLTNAYTHLVMDLPGSTHYGWDVLVGIFDAGPVFNQRYRVFNETNVLRFLASASDNASSIVSSVRAARENVRTTRDVLPEETWELVNELYLYTSEHADRSVGRRNRYEFLEQVINRCQMISGLLLTTLCRDHAYRFIKLGNLLERADMTTRIIDVGVGAIIGGGGEVDPATEPLLWSSLLQSISALGTYRRNIGPVLDPNWAVNFVFKEITLPRSVAFCLRGIRKELKPLRDNAEASRLVASAERKLARFDAQRIDAVQLHQFIDRLQANLSDLNVAILDTWCLPAEH